MVKSMHAGSLEAIAYLFFQLVDEIFHAFDILWGNCAWRLRFCQWTHRKEWERPQIPLTLTEMVEDEGNG